MPIPFDDWDFTKATNLLANRVSKAAQVRRAFRDGNHWQNGSGYIGQLPPQNDPNYQTIIEAVRLGFQSENVIAEVAERHIDGVLGREPFWGLVPATIPTERQRRRMRVRKLLRGERMATPPQPTPPAPAPPPAPGPDPARTTVPPDSLDEADDALVNWWDENDILTSVFEDLTDKLLLEETAVLRVFVSWEHGEGGEMPNVGSLDEALALIRVEVLGADKGGVFRDKTTQRKVAVCQYEQGDEQNRQQFVELSYLDDDGNTVFKVIGRDGKVVSEADPPYRLGGRLLVYEVKRKALINEQVCQNNRALNLALTKMMRNVNMAGDRGLEFLNTEPPGRWVDADGKEWVEGESVGSKIWEKGPNKVGAGIANFRKGIELYDKEGNPTGRADPNLNVLEPVDIKTFTGTRDQFYEAILGQCRQRFALISGDATASGRSREQARAEFEKSLKRTKTPLDGAGRWLLMVVLLLAADLCGRVEEFLDLRAEFNTLVEAGPLSPEERKELREDVKSTPPLLSAETYMTRTGTDDPDAEQERIDAQPERQQPEPAPGPGGEGE